ncbi:DUF6401 family natural product biosynthesis protein [Actinoplanes teichomyceticus]|uniref:Uncharacterized protein n=1 Tax=Actinoplanes teichomyceticus TaxID=1867 RepID=A0A561VJ47_ACTTI|nr:DUF6401 family natural product biosynthesis protein [Actinoplanes teichomyceticus]TWG11620.1 hypothetical protein FHX34_106350 [Actinoplanes teichomyceticus]GIF16067.1 hypothetical protein Ate01nite_60990 [Actinoplanes teichomyceticus]
MELDQLGREAVTAGARLALDQWSRRLGAPPAMTPGLLAQLDQHMTHILDALDNRADTVSLAAYADGVADAAGARGWSADEIAADWRDASWPSVHLLAVCLLATRHLN